MQEPWEAMLTFSEGAKPKDARQNSRMQGYPWGSCSSLLCGLTVLSGGAAAWQEKEKAHDDDYSQPA